MERRVLSLIMALAILLTMLPTSALAQEMETPAAGASVEATKGTPETTAPTTAPTVTVTASTEGSVPATEDSVLSTEGDIAPQNGEGSAVYSNGYVAEINGTPYETLEEALDHVDEGEITLLDNISVEVLEIYGATINMNGHSITSAIEAYDSLTLKDGTVNGTVKVDGGTFTLTAAGAEVAINGELNVISGSCSVTGAKVGVKGTLYFDGTDMLITGTDKAVDLDKAAEPASKTFYGSTSVDGETTEEATFDTDTYKVSGGVAMKLTNKLSDNVTPPAQASVTLDSTEQNVTAGETVTFTATYTGTGTLDAYIQKNGQDENVAVTLERAEDGTYTVSAKIDAETPTRDYTLYVHEVNNSFVQAKATIHVTALTPVAEVNGKRYALLNNAFAAANDGDTVTMLANHTTDWEAVDAGDESTLAIVTKKLTLDLNGKTVDHLMVGDIAFDEETQTITAVYPGYLTVMSSREGGTVASTINALDFVKGTLEIQSGQIGYSGGSGLTCNGDSGSVTISGGTVLGLTVGEGASVTVSGGTLHGGNWFNDGTLDITGGTFSDVSFLNNGGTIAISGGTFGAITNNDASTLIPPMSLLAKGYAFYGQYDDTLKDGSVRDALKNVTVKAHTHTIKNGKCDCGLAATVSDSKGDFYNTLQAALDAAAKDSTIQWVQPEQDLTEQVTFDTADAVVTVRMNGKTLTAPNNDAPAVAVSGGTLIFADAATISMPTTADPWNKTITYAVSISGGKLVFQGDLTARGGEFNNPGNATTQAPAVYANGGELDFQGKLDLKSGLTISGTAKLTRKLTQGTFWTDCMSGDRLSVTGASNYKHLEDLLADGYAFVDKDDHNVFRCVSSFKSWSGSDVTIVPHKHTWGPSSGDLYDCIECGKSCGHPNGYPDGKCPVCGKPCPHDMADQSSTDFHYYCRYCGKQMFARIQTDTYKWSFFPNLKDAMAAAEDGQTIVLLDDIDNSDQTAAVTGNGKTVTLDLNGHTITNGWIYVGISEDNMNDQTSSTLKIIGSGSFINTGDYGNLSVGYSATLDLSGWVGENNTITRVALSKNGNEQPNPESLLIVSENIGTIGTLGFYNWPSSGIKTKLTGGTYGSITITTHVNDGEPYSSMLAPGYAFQYVGTNEFVEYTKKAEYTGVNTINNVTVVKCTHGGTNGFDINSMFCPYCGAPAVASTALKNVDDGNPWRNFADLQTALNADRDGSSTLSLLTGVTGDYTINGTQNTGLDLNGHSIKGTVTVKGIKGDFITTTLSNTQNTTTASIDKVVAFDGAELAGSGYPAVIGELTLAEGATWNNILNDTALGYKVLNADGTHTWYAPNDVNGSQLNNVIINRLPITRKNLAFKVNGTNVKGNKVERGTTVQLCASCNTKGADVYIYIGEIIGNNDPTYTYSQKKAEYKKIGSSWYYVVDLDANTIGSYDIYFTATKDGYSVTSSHKKLTVTKLNLSKAVITFPNGNESVYQPYNTTTGVPPYVVTYNGSELKAGVDYTVVSGDSRSTVGTATLTIKATDDGDYTGQKTARWTVAAHKATISVGDIIKVYDGTTDLPANASVKLKSADSRYAPSGGPLPLVAGEDYQILNASYDSANASEDEKTVSFTITLTDRNYTFEDGTTQKAFTLNGADVSQTFKISQATVTPNEITQYVFNDLAKTYEIDLRTLLPELPVGCEYGKIHNRGCNYHFTDSTYLDSSNNIFVSNEGILTLPIVSAHNTDVNGQIGTITVPIVSTNYQQFDLTIKVVIGEKIQLDQSGVTVSASNITYGQTLANSTLTATGSMICPRTQAVIPGTFAWKDGTIKPNAGSYDAEWTFTPAEGYEEYAPATGAVTVTVEPAELTRVSVRASSTYYTGKPQHASTIAFGQSVDGTTVTFTYSNKVDGDYTSDGPTFTDAGTYTVYYKAEAANHKTATGTFTVTIAPLPISLLSVERSSKSYDGTANVTLTASRLTFFSKAASRSGIILPDTALTFSDAQFTMKQADGSYLPSPEAGNGKALSFTMTLANDNYVLEREPEGTKTVSDTFATDDTTRFTINKAAAPVLTAYPVTRKYTLKTEQTIPLPDLESLGMPGDAQVSDTNAFHSGSYSPAGKIEDGWGIDVNTGAITYTLAEGVAPGNVITFTLLVRSKNYEDAAVTVILTLTERDTPILTLPDSITVDYTGAGIPVSAVTGKRAAFDGKDVPGTWSWKAGQTITNAADTGTKTIVFTPDDPVNYLPAEGTVSVTISPVAPAYTAPTAMDGLIYSGSAQALVNAGSTAHGKLLYSLSKDGAYSETVPTGTDAGEYTVWYKVAGDSNHTDTQPASVTVTVVPKTATATVTVSGDSLTYTGDPLKPGVIVKDGDTVISPEEYDVSYRDNVNAGTATVTVRSKAGGNYTVSGSTTFEIGKAASEVRTAPGANTGLVYNGGEQALVTTGTALGGKLKYRLGESGGFTEALPKAANAGTYTVYYMVEGDGNHRDSEIYSLTVTIGKARVTVTALDKRIYTDDKAPDLSKPVLGKDYTVTGLFGEDALTGDIKLAYVDASGTEITPDTTKVGKVIIRAGGLTAPNDNYTVVFADGKLTVDERPVYTVKATAGSHGSITPSGNVDVLHGGSQTFTIAANSGYAISNVKVDGVSIGAVKSYTFENVTENHTIEVTFMKANGNPQTGVMVDEVTGEYYVA